jgi:hypothetical protein
MNDPKTKYEFTCALESIDLCRIVDEAGTGVSAILVTIAGQAYTIARQRDVLKAPVFVRENVIGAITNLTQVRRSILNPSCVFIHRTITDAEPWRPWFQAPGNEAIILSGDHVKALAGGVTVNVEVF